MNNNTQQQPPQQLEKSKNVKEMTTSRSNVVQVSENDDVPPQKLNFSGIFKHKRGNFFALFIILYYLFFR